MQMKLQFNVPLEKCVEVSKAVLAILDEHNVNFDLTQQPPVKETPAEIICPNDIKCGWAGDVVDLRINKEWNVGCPKCGHIISRSNFGLSPIEWAELGIGDKVGYTLVTADGDEFDIDCAWATQFNSPTCEDCQETNVGEPLFGTSDSREPFWCLSHYLRVNRGSRFIKKGV